MSNVSNVLIRPNGVSEYQISYADNGNIITKTDVGDYLYDAGSKPHAMRGIEGVAGYGVTDDPQTLSYTYFNKVSSVEQTAQRYNIYYGLDHQRRKSEKLRVGHLYHTRYYMGSCEIDIDSLGQECISEYIYTPSGLTAIYREGQLLYVHSDHLGSIAAVSDSASRVVCTYAYTPWGGRLLLSGESVTDRGYTLHEHIDPFGLIDMSGRMYDPVLARFLSPDPYVQAPDFTQSFNRYAYCWNNPFSYTDPSGEFIHVILGAAIGGIFNVLSNLQNIQSFGEGLLYFGMGAVVGASAAALGGVTAGCIQAAGVWAGAGIGAVVGAASGGISNVLLNGGNNLIQGGNFFTNWERSLVSGVINGAVSGAIGGAKQAYEYAVKNDANPWTRVVNDKNDFVKPYLAELKEGVPLQPNPERGCYASALEYADKGHQDRPASFFLDQANNADGASVNIVARDAKIVRQYSGKVGANEWDGIGGSLVNKGREVIATINLGDTKHCVNITKITIGNKLNYFGGGKMGRTPLSFGIWDPLSGHLNKNSLNIETLTILKY